MIVILTSYLNFEIKKLLKVTWSSEIISTNTTFRNEVSAFAMSQLKWDMVKSFVQENKFHTYLTHETLPAEERASNLHDHGKTPSYQSFADASMRKVAWILRKSVEGKDEKALLSFKTGTECHDSGYLHELQKLFFRRNFPFWVNYTWNLSMCRKSVTVNGSDVDHARVWSWMKVTQVKNCELC